MRTTVSMILMLNISQKSSAVTRCPADLPKDMQERLRALAVKAFLALDGEGLSRADFFYTPDGRLVINEVNTMPGFTPISMYKTMWETPEFPIPN